MGMIITSSGYEIQQQLADGQWFDTRRCLEKDLAVANLKHLRENFPNAVWRVVLRTTRDEVLEM